MNGMSWTSLTMTNYLMLSSCFTSVGEGERRGRGGEREGREEEGTKGEGGTINTLRNKIGWHSTKQIGVKVKWTEKMGGRGRGGERGTKRRGGGKGEGSKF